MQIVVSAKAGTHHHQRLLEQSRQSSCQKRQAAAYGSPLNPAVLLRRLLQISDEIGATARVRHADIGHAVGGDDKRSIKRGVSSRIIQERSSVRSIKRMPEFRRETPLFRNIHKFFFRDSPLAMRLLKRIFRS
jgi:hypothetical protein